MSEITMETRREAHLDVVPKKETRQQLIVGMLGQYDGLTAEELTELLVANGDLRYYDMNFVRPRLTELLHAGVVETTEKRKSARTGRTTAVWTLKKEGAASGAGTPSAAEHKNSLTW